MHEHTQAPIYYTFWSQRVLHILVPTRATHSGPNVCYTFWSQRVLHILVLTCATHSGPDVCLRSRLAVHSNEISRIIILMDWSVILVFTIVQVPINHKIDSQHEQINRINVIKCQGRSTITQQTILPLRVVPNRQDCLGRGPESGEEYQWLPWILAPSES